MPADTVMFVDDEQGVLSSLKRLLRREPYTVITASSGPEALILIDQHVIQVAISDQRMPGMAGTEFLRKVKERQPETIRVVLSGYADLASILEAINKGEIYRFLTKPWNDEELKVSIRQCLEQYALRLENRELTRRVEEQNARLRHEHGLSSGALRVIQDMLAELPVPVLGIGDKGMVVMANHMLCERFQRFSGDIVGRQAEKVLPRGLIDLVEACGNAPTVTLKDELVIDGQVVEVRVKALSVRENMNYVLVFDPSTGCSNDLNLCVSKRGKAT